MKYRRAKRDHLRALTSEILPYEVPLPFDVTRLYDFLRRLGFRWESPHTFSVLARRLSNANRQWLGLIFDPITLGDKGTAELSGGKELRTTFSLSDGGGSRPDLRHPYKYRSRRNNGKSRNLAIPHPHSMLSMASFIHTYRDSILYFTNRSNYSIRHPHRVARMQSKGVSVFDGVQDHLSYRPEQSDLEYAHVSSYFSYRRYNNINRFYSSPEFQACERKYPRLLRADVAKCFDSVYTHTISWVTNGMHASKNRQTETSATFGGQFDHLMQYLNYAETSGIIIGPELSRIFAEVILQEVDVRVERDLEHRGLTRGTHYEIMRYVDDYFIFIGDTHKTEMVEEVLASHLAVFKLHLNDEKQHQFDTPLASHMSVAKSRIREDLKRRTRLDHDDQQEPPTAELYFSAKQAILDYKALLIDTELDHGELANSYLYELGRRRDRTVLKFRTYLDRLRDAGDPLALHRGRILLVNYLAGVLDVAVFIYSGAPSVSHSVKLCRIVAASLGELEVNQFGALQTRQFKDHVRSEIGAQLTAVHDEKSFGAHTLFLLDCLIYLDPGMSDSVLLEVLSRRGMDVQDLDALGVLTLLRRFNDPGEVSALKSGLLERARALVQSGREHQDDQTARALLLLSLPTFPGARPSEIAKAMGDGISQKKVELLRTTEHPPSTFSWDASENYYERLLLKSAQFVY